MYGRAAPVRVSRTVLVPVLVLVGCPGGNSQVKGWKIIHLFGQLLLLPLALLLCSPLQNKGWFGDATPTAQTSKQSTDPWTPLLCPRLGAGRRVELVED